MELGKIDKNLCKIVKEHCAICPRSRGDDIGGRVTCMGTRISPHRVRESLEALAGDIQLQEQLDKLYKDAIKKGKGND